MSSNHPSVSVTSQITEEEISTSTRVLEHLLSDEILYDSKSCRKLRKVISQLFELQKSRMFGGMTQQEYDADREKKKRATVELQQKRLEDRKYIEKTVLRAGRMRALRSLLTQEGASEAPLILDGVAEEDRSAIGTHTHTHNVSVLNESSVIQEGSVNTVKDENTKDTGVMDTAEDTAVRNNASNANASMSTTDLTSSSLSSASSSERARAHLQIARACYTCKKRFRELHHFYDLLCPSCAQLNYMKRLQTVDLTGRVALVTGARVKIGFQCCLKLLRCGASVIATSRFPKDAAERFAAQPDVSSWSHRLHVFGLDLRDLASVEAFCAMIQRDYTRLDIIINNACQTVRRPPAYYSPLIENERVVPVERSLPRLFLERNVTHHIEKKKWISNGGYIGSSEKTGSDSVVSASETAIPSLTYTDSFQTNENGKNLSAASGSISTISTLSSSELSQLAMIPGDSIIDPLAFPDGLRDVNKQQVDLRTCNSWLLRAHEVSTPELVEVMAINAISPFILNARLKSLMEKSSPIISVTIPRSSSSTTTSSSNTDEKGTVQTTDISSSSSTLSHHIIGHASLSSMSLAESILSSFSPENVEAAGRAFTKMSGGGSAKTGSRGHPVGGANKRPRKETGGGAGLEGDKAEHGVPASLCKFIVNVSSMEGKFYRAKTPSHPHTNMAKSSLNQLTRTSAGDYAESHIYMNAVDTGWINDENPLVIAARTADRHGFATPLDEVDAAARILDPVIAPLLQAYETGGGICAPVYGAFLKDFAETEW